MAETVSWALGNEHFTSKFSSGKTTPPVVSRGFAGELMETF